MIKYILILTVTFSTVFSTLTGTDCDCTEIQYQADCKGGCAWSTTTLTCSAAACKSFDIKMICDAAPQCAWNNAGTCEDFTSCSAYTISSTGNASDCYSKNKTCIPGTVNSDGTIPCIVGTVTCSTFKTEDTCLGYQSDGQACVYNGSTCIAQNITSCSTLTDSAVCQSNYCTYANSVCTGSTCSSITTQEKCTAVQATAQNQSNICIWSNNSCIDATNVSTLDASNCFTNTQQTYTWNSATSTCKACTGTPVTSSSIIFFVFGFIILL